MKTLDWLYGLQAIGVKLGLENMRKLLEALPLQSPPPLTFHVAGTNGKGSVCACLDAILRAHGRRTGLFTSPHLVRYQERIRVDGQPISERETDEGLRGLQSLMADWDPHPSFFEVTLALAMDHFARRQVECLVLETGLGGRLDATNAVEPRHVSVITTIDHDHNAILGSTLDAIAREKAGIFRPGVPVISAPQCPEATAALRQVAETRKAPITFVTEPYTGPLGLAGAHQRINAAVALAALEAVAFPLSLESASLALTEVRWPGRFHRVGEQIVIDGAHNPSAAAALAATWREQHGDSPATVIFGCAQEKDPAKTLAALAPIAQRFLFTRINSPRSRDPQSLCEWVSLPAQAFPSLAEALESARSHSAPILITGSLFLAGEALALLAGDPLPPPTSQ